MHINEEIGISKLAAKQVTRKDNQMKNLIFDEISEEENNKIHKNNIKAFDEAENYSEKYLTYTDKENNIKEMTLSEKIELAEKSEDREILEILSRYDNSNIRFNIATNADTPENILDKIINKEINDKKIIESIYERPDISINKKAEVSKILKCQDEIKGMTFMEKKYLARTTDDAQNIAILSKYENPRIHMQLVLNEHTPESVINDILDNDFNDHEIAKAVLSRKDISEEVKEKAEKICLNEKNIENDKADSNKLLFDKEENNEEVSEVGIINNLQEFSDEKKEQLKRNNLTIYNFPSGAKAIVPEAIAEKWIENDMKGNIEIKNGYELGMDGFTKGTKNIEQCI